YQGERFSVTAATGVIRWDSEDQTDLDYTAAPLARRSNVEDATQFTQEVRVSSSPGRALALSDAASLRWQAGVLLFTHDYSQNAVNTLAPFTVSPQIPFSVDQTTPRATL